jgi:hypothetical protein
MTESVTLKKQMSFVTQHESLSVAHGCRRDMLLHQAVNGRLYGLAYLSEAISDNTFQNVAQATPSPPLKAAILLCVRRREREHLANLSNVNPCYLDLLWREEWVIYLR